MSERVGGALVDVNMKVCEGLKTIAVMEGMWITSSVSLGMKW